MRVWDRACRGEIDESFCNQNSWERLLNSRWVPDPYCIARLGAFTTSSGNPRFSANKRRKRFRITPLGVEIIFEENGRPKANWTTESLRKGVRYSRRKWCTITCWQGRVSVFNFWRSRSISRRAAFSPCWMIILQKQEKDHTCCSSQPHLSTTRLGTCIGK